jgi:hypothetical protein
MNEAPTWSEVLLENWRAMGWTAIGLLMAGITGYDLGAGQPLTAWWWAGLVCVIAWPFIVREEYAVNR